MTVVRCTDCGLIYARPLPIPESISDHYGLPPEEYWHEEALGGWEHHFERELRFLRVLNPNAKTFLDVGSGLGETMRAVEASGLSAYGIEPGADFYDRALSRGISADRLMLGAFEEVEVPIKFDIVSFGVVLEHLYDPSAAIAKALNLLNAGGIVHVHVPSAKFLFSKLFNLYFWLCRTDFVVNLSPMHVPFHLYEFTEESFARNGRRLGYTVEQIDRYPGSAVLVPRLSKALAPVMRATNTGLGLIAYLRKQ